MVLAKYQMCDQNGVWTLLCGVLCYCSFSGLLHLLDSNIYIDYALFKNDIKLVPEMVYHKSMGHLHILVQLISLDNNDIVCYSSNEFFPIHDECSHECIPVLDKYIQTSIYHLKC